MFKKSSISGITLESAGLVALADLPTVAVRTALMGTASWLDILVLAPGMHQQQSADEVNRGEFRLTGSLTSGYVFRVENPATVSYLQSIGRTGHLVTAKVNNQRIRRKAESLGLERLERGEGGGRGGGDLLVVLSQDRWVRLHGKLSDVKRVTAGQWLRDEDRAESLAVGFATLLVYAAAALAGNASTIGSLVIAVLLICSVALLALCNSLTRRLQMYNCIVQEAKTLRTHYDRRLEMVKEPGKEDVEQQRYDCGIGRGREGKTGEWATQMGLIKDSELQAILQEFESPSKGSQAFSVSSIPADV